MESKPTREGTGISFGGETGITPTEWPIDAAGNGERKKEREKKKEVAGPSSTTGWPGIDVAPK